jgi:hypothetical protein
MLGQVVYTKTDLELKQEVDISLLSKGLYYVILRAKEAQNSLKIVKE